MFNKIKFVNVFALLLLFFAGCGSQKDAPIRINIGAEPQTLDPRKARDLQAQTLTRMFFDGLMRLGKDEKPECSLAKTYEVSDDGCTYTFHLRDAQWTNGDVVTAHDFAYAWKKVLDPKFPSDQAFQLYVISNAQAAIEGKVPLEEVGIRVLDDKTLQVRLTNPTAHFLELTTLSVFFPVNSRVDQENPHWDLNADTYVCNGPFQPAAWKHSDQIEAVKNPHYWDAEHVQLKRIELVMVSEDAELKMYEKRQLDWAGSPLSILPVNALPELKKKDKLQAQPFLATYFFRANVGKKPLDNADLRKALALSINRTELVDHVTQGAQIPATGLVPISMGLQSGPYFKDGDVEEAQKYLGKAEAVSGKAPPLTYIYVAGERNYLIAQAVQQQWRAALGIEVRLEAVERKVYFDRLSRRDFDLAASSWEADFHDPLNFLSIFKLKNGGSNNTNWENAKYTALLKKAESTLDSQERKECLQKAEAILIEEMPIIPVFHRRLLYVKKQALCDVVLSSLGALDFKWAYIASEERK
ncbi:MAG: peptide ABC transporter substrate-binding protein [Verrucomicrobia bacterium]|nr:peptide ABC transporter substrate-binding protein [Verrucomicrobiota bacterium]